MSAPTRRGLLGGAAILAAAPGAVKAKGMVTTTISKAHPDAELLEACAAFDVLERAYLATFRGFEFDSPEERAGEVERERIAETQHPIVDRICGYHAVTKEGQTARARSFALWDAELMKPQDDIAGQFMQAIVRDLIGGTGA